MKRLLPVVLLVSLATFPSAGFASNKITSGATNARLVVVDANTAVVSYRAQGKDWSVVASGAINARFPSRTVPQVKFRLTYAQNAPATGSCGRYNGPRLAWVVAACKGVAGDYWVVQSWPRNLPNYGETPRRPDQAENDLRISHWRGPLPVFTVKLDWAYQRFDHMYGSLTYLGRPMHGFGTTTYGAPTDSHGVLIYVDTLKSAYGQGWHRENSFVTHNPTGIFCYGFYPHGARPAGKGSAYRATVVGPGVLPDLMWRARAPGPYDPDKDAAANAEQQAKFSDGLCRPR